MSTTTLRYTLKCESAELLVFPRKSTELYPAKIYPETVLAT